jgi:hypothetical protein
LICIIQIKTLSKINTIANLKGAEKDGSADLMGMSQHDSIEFDRLDFWVKASN